MKWLAGLSTVLETTDTRARPANLLKRSSEESDCYEDTTPPSPTKRVTTGQDSVAERDHSKYTLDSRVLSQTQSTATELGRSSKTKIVAESLVVEGRRSTKSKCWRYHLKGKKPLTELRNSLDSCAMSDEQTCERSIIYRTVESPLDDQCIIVTRSPASDLKWWFGSASLQDYLLYGDHFTDDQVRTALIDGAADLKNTFAELEGLKEYAQRAPYGLSCTKAGREFDTNYLSFTPPMAAGHRDDVEDDCTLVKNELLYLEQEVEALKARIVRRKAQLAEKGDDDELASLYVHGYCDEVYAICKAQENAQECGGIKIA